MDIEHVHSQGVRCQFQRLENLLQCHGSFPIVSNAYGLVAMILQCLLNKAEEMLLVHTRCRMDVCVNLEETVGDQFGCGSRL